MAKDMTTERDVAVKFEKQTVRKSQVIEEGRILKDLLNL